MTINYAHVLLVLVAFVASGCKKDSSADPNTAAKTIESLTVKNNEIAGWSYTGTAWVARNITELTAYIDGMAEINRKYGFVDAAHQEYSGRINNVQVVLKLTVYNHGNEANALALYNDPAMGFSGALDWAGGAGVAAHYVRNGGLSQVLAFYRASYYASLEINTDTDESLNILRQFALNVDGKIKNG